MTKLNNKFPLLIAALKKFADEGVQVIITYPNNDAGSDQIIAAIRGFKHNNVQVIPSLGHHFYHGVLGLSLDRKAKVCCAGNSSSGIKETPMFGCPTVNIGTRQLGRLRGENVTTVGYDEDEIYQAISKSMFDEEYRTQCFNTLNPYYVKNSASKIANTLAIIPIDRKLVQKAMTLKGEKKSDWYR